MDTTGNHSNRLQGLRDWCGKMPGSALAGVEQGALFEVLGDVFGYHLVVVDPCSQPVSLNASRILHRVIQSKSDIGLENQPDLLASPELMALQTDSVDALVLPHVLETAENPHQVLREVDRCLVPEGHVIVLGFNPLGWWGLRKLITIRRKQIPWSLQFISLPKLKDWLSLLGFETIATRYLFAKSPWQVRPAAPGFEILEKMNQLGWPLFAASYVLVARKRVATLTQIKPRWRPRRSVLAGGVAQTTQGKVTTDG